MVKQRIDFKIATLTYRSLQSGSPSYLSSLINLNNLPRPLRSASLSLLHVPCTAKAVGRKAFRFAAPTIWNYSTKYQVTTIHWLFQTQSQNSPLFPPRLAMFPTLLYVSASESSSLEFVRYINSVIIIIMMIIIDAVFLRHSVVV